MLVSTLPDVPTEKWEAVGLISRSLCLNFKSMKDYLPLSSFGTGPGIGRNATSDEAVTKALGTLTRDLTHYAQGVGADAVLGVRLEMSPMREDQILFVLTGTAIKFMG